MLSYILFFSLLLILLRCQVLSHTLLWVSSEVPYLVVILVHEAIVSPGIVLLNHGAHEQSGTCQNSVKFLYKCVSIVKFLESVLAYCFSCSSFGYFTFFVSVHTYKTTIMCLEIVFSPGNFREQS